MAGTFEIYEDKGGEYRFRLKAGNGETVLASEGYKSKSSAQNGVESVMKNATDEARFEGYETDGGAFRFRLKAGNHETIGTSESYTTSSARDNGIAAVGRAAAGALIKDLTQA